jgi:type IV secretory pathway TraG/TraD family ATPase VirD4
MALHKSDIIYFGRTNFRNARRIFGIKRADRRHHMYIVGKTGTGKSTLVETMVRQDIANGEGLAICDPHGDLVERIRRTVPAHRRDDMIWFDLTDRNSPIGYNPLASVPEEKRALAASGILDVMKKLWVDSWGPRLEHILRNSLLALLDVPGATFADILQLMSDDEFRRHAMHTVTNRQVRTFWLKEYAGYPARFRAEAIAPIQNKVGAFLSNPLLRAVLTAKENHLDLRNAIDNRKILLVNLSKGRIGEDTASLLGALLVASLGFAAFSRSDIPEDERRDFWIYLDEFHTVTTLSLANMLSELRKYRAGLVLANQYLAQLDEPIRAAILGNVGTLVTFRLGYADAEILAQEFTPVFEALDLANLPNHEIYLKLMVDGVPSAPFSAETLRLPN